MYSPCNRALGALTAAFFGAVLVHRAETAVLKVCVDEASPNAATDQRVAREAGKSQDDAVEITMFAGYGRGGEGLPPSRFAKMAESDCDLIMGFPVDVSNPNLPTNVEATSAYAATGFVMVRRRGSADTPLADMPHGSKVGIAQLDTYAGLLFETHPNLVMHVYPKDSLMLGALQAGRISAAVGWQPSIVLLARGRAGHAPVDMAVLPGPHMVWNLVALYAPRSRSAANAFNRGLYALSAQRRLEQLIAPFQRATAMPATSRLSSPSALRPAVAWDTEMGRAMTVSEATSGVKSRHSKPPALYTTDQAAKGALAYYQNCAMCHSPLLDGQTAGYPGPALKGPDFADPSYDFHLSDIFNFVAKLMPSATPGSLSHEQYVQIMAFILQQNGYPAGDNELVYEVAEKSKVPIRYYGK